MSAGLSISEATYNAATKKFEGTMEGRDPTGALIKTRSVTEYSSADHRLMTMYMTMPDGKEMQTMRITYTRRK